MKIKNVKGYRSSNSSLVVIALNTTVGIIVQEGDDFKINQARFEFYPFEDGTEWVKLGNKETKKLYEKWITQY